jgi:predicted nucleic acid-binding Zn ribbon protein
MRGNLTCQIGMRAESKIVYDQYEGIALVGKAMTNARQHCWVCHRPITWGQSDTACRDRCRRLLYAESYRIARHKEESYRKGRPYNLQLSEWIETLWHYNWRCAFCEGPFESLDHFIPVSQGGASWVGNVVPSCLRCQSAKGNLLPDEIETIPKARLEMIARYLERRSRKASK